MGIDVIRSGFRNCFGDATKRSVQICLPVQAADGVEATIPGSLYVSMRALIELIGSNIRYGLR